MTVERLPGETELEYHKRIVYGKLVDKTLADNDYSELAPYVYGQSYSTDVARRMFYGSCKTLQIMDSASEEAQGERVLDQLTAKKIDLQKERYKLETEKREYSRWMREDARDDLYVEKIINSIRENIGQQAEIRDIPIVHNGREGVLCIADAHFGKDFKIYGVFNEVINEYSPEIFYSRMEMLYNSVVDTVRKEGLTQIRVYNLGDSVDGFLRHSQLWTLRYGVIDSAILFGNYMGDWLRKLSSVVNVVYAQTDGNHDELRLLDGRKGQHLNESAGKIVRNCIKLKNEDNPNFEMIENNTGLIYDVVCGFGILGIHGEVKDMAKAISEFECMYDVGISYLIGGHMHNEKYQNCGIRKGTIGAGSLVGIDDFSVSIRKAADATSSMIIFEEGRGKSIQYTYVLN